MPDAGSSGRGDAQPSGPDELRRLLEKEIASGSWTHRCDQLACEWALAMLRCGQDPKAVMRQVTSAGIRKKEARKIVQGAIRTSQLPSAGGPDVEAGPLTFGVVSAPELLPAGEAVPIEAEGVVEVGDHAARVVLKVRPGRALRALFAATGLGICAAWSAILSFLPHWRFLHAVNFIVLGIAWWLACRLRVRSKWHFHAAVHGLRTWVDEGAIGLELRDGKWLCLRLVPDDKRDHAQQYLLVRAFEERYLGHQGEPASHEPRQDAPC